MIYITGDCHSDVRRFSKCCFPEQAEMTKDDIVIICGDFGLVWDYTGKGFSESYWLNWLNDKPFTTVFVCGNHENFDRLYSYPVKNWNGGKVHEIRPSVLHLMRGEVYEIEGLKFFAFGGASSHDIKDGILDLNDFPNGDDFIATCKKWQRSGKMFRIKNISWWEQELPTQEEMDHGIKSLEENDYKVDFVISHCLPQSIAATFSKGLYESDKLTMYFNQLLDNGLSFENWYCGHYHCDMDIMSKYHIRYEKIERIV